MIKKSLQANKPKAQNKVSTLSYFKLFIIFVFFIFIAKLYYDRAVAFNFVDEYNSFMTAYFMQKGRVLYSEIFLNHQMGMSYISYLIQSLLKINNLYQLILYHRLFVILFSFLMGIILLIRFNIVGITVFILFELSKFYLFGNLFLAESLIVYPLVYLLLIAIKRIQNSRILKIDILISAFFTLFVVLLREPFIPLAILLFSLILIDKKYIKFKVFIFLGLITFILLPLFFYDIREYYFQLVTINLQTIIAGEVRTNNLAGSGLFKMVFYPIYSLFSGEWNHMRFILIVISVLYIWQIIMCFISRKFKLILGLTVLLALANIRVVPPGLTFYGSFHLLPWLSLTLAATFYLILKNNGVKYLYISFFIVILTIFLPKQSYIYQKNDRNELFNLHYANFYVTGETVRLLSNSNDTFFVDGYEALHIWQSKLDSSYKYAFYYPVIEGISPFAEEKERMFENNPPDFYYTFCNNIKLENNNLKIGNTNFKQLYYNDNPICLYINANTYNQISSEKWEKVSSLGIRKID